MPYLYNFINRQDRSVYQSRKVAKGDYSSGVAGLPGNSDAGAMQILLDIIEFSVLDVKMMAFPGLFLMVGL